MRRAPSPARRSAMKRATRRRRAGKARCEVHRIANRVWAKGMACCAADILICWRESPTNISPLRRARVVFVSVNVVANFRQSVLRRSGSRDRKPFRFVTPGSSTRLGAWAVRCRTVVRLFGAPGIPVYSCATGSSQSIAHGQCRGYITVYRVVGIRTEALRTIEIHCGE